MVQKYEEGSGGSLVLPFFVLAALVVNHALFRLGALAWPWTALVVVVVLSLALMNIRAPLAAPSRELWRRSNALIGIIILAPLAASLLLGWNREFPFSGDSYFHVGQNARLAFWWLSPAGTAAAKVPNLDDVRRLASAPLMLLQARLVVLVLIAGVTALVYRFRPFLALGFGALALLAWGSQEASIFLRYPAGGYFLSMPFLAPAFLLKNPELAGRLTSVAAAVAWLFVLRPWLVGRWPDLRILPVALLLLWHKDVIYYFDSVYLEPWALVFVLLAIEVLIARGREGAPAACLLVGAAACVKEPFILALPLVWLAGAPWSGPWTARLQVTAAAVAAGVPFVVYFAARQSVPLDDIGVNRSVHFAPPSPWTDYLSQFSFHLNAAFPSVTALLAVVALAMLIPALMGLRECRRVVACMAAAGFGLLLFFTFDQSSQSWAGYFRFLLYAIPFLLAGVMAFSHALPARWLWPAVAVIALLQVPSVYTALARAAGPSTERNFVEHDDAPIVFPMRSVIREATGRGLLAPHEPVQASLVDSTLRPLPGESINYGPLGTLYCECSGEHRNVLALFVRFNNFASSFAGHPAEGERVAGWQKANAQRPACLVRLKQTCGHVIERIEDGETVAALGTAR